MNHSKSRVLRAGIVFVGLLAGLSQTAMGTDQPPPVRSLIDANGVNLIDGSFNYAGAQVVIGQPGQGGLSRAFIGGAGAAMG